MKYACTAANWLFMPSPSSTDSYLSAVINFLRQEPFESQRLKQNDCPIRIYLLEVSFAGLSNGPVKSRVQFSTLFTTISASASSFTRPLKHTDRRSFDIDENRSRRLFHPSTRHRLITPVFPRIFLPIFLLLFFFVSLFTDFLPIVQSIYTR